MARIGANMQKLTEMRERLQRQIAESERATEALKNELKGLEAAIAAVGGAEVTLGESAEVTLGESSVTNQRRRNVKATTMDLIVEAGEVGITATEVVERAAARGRTLPLPSISSLLSRLKREGTLRFDGERYYPTKAAALLSMMERAAA